MATKKSLNNSTTKVKRTRSRFGCNNCKKMKIKCDETKPQCSNCCKSKKYFNKCDYTMKLSWGGRPYKNEDRKKAMQNCGYQIDEPKAKAAAPKNVTFVTQKFEMDHLATKPSVVGAESRNYTNENIRFIDEYELYHKEYSVITSQDLNPAVDEDSMFGSFDAFFDTERLAKKRKTSSSTGCSVLPTDSESSEMSNFDLGTFEFKDSSSSITSIGSPNKVFDGTFFPSEESDSAIDAFRYDNSTFLDRLRKNESYSNTFKPLNEPQDGCLNDELSKLVEFYDLNQANLVKTQVQDSPIDTTLSSIPEIKQEFEQLMPSLVQPQLPPPEKVKPEEDVKDLVIKIKVKVSSNKVFSAAADSLKQLSMVENKPASTRKRTFDQLVTEDLTSEPEDIWDAFIDMCPEPKQAETKPNIAITVNSEEEVNYSSGQELAAGDLSAEDGACHYYKYLTVTISPYPEMLRSSSHYRELFDYFIHHVADRIGQDNDLECNPFKQALPRMAFQSDLVLYGLLTLALNFKKIQA